MSMDLAARLLILTVSLCICFGEYVFFRKGEQVSATVLEKVRFRSESRSDFDLDGEKVTNALRLNVRLDQAGTDGREGLMAVSPEAWKSASDGETKLVFALAHKPRWMVWSPMIRRAEMAGNLNRVYLALGFVLFASIFVIAKFL